MNDDLRRDAHGTLVICAAATCTVAALAIALRLTLADAARTLLDYRFAPADPSVAGAASILATNARKLAGLYGLALVAQAPWRAAADPGRRGPRALRLACDAGALALLAPTAILIAVATAGYGGRMLAAMLPHGPLELAAFALALGVYRDARRGPVTVRRLLTRAGAGLLLLAVAAAIETYAGIPT